MKMYKYEKAQGLQWIILFDIELFTNVRRFSLFVFFYFEPSPELFKFIILQLLNVM